MTTQNIKGTDRLLIKRKEGEMNKRAKSILAYSLLSISILAGIILFTNIVIAYSSGNSALSIDYNLITHDIAGRHYTPTCIGTCDLVFSLSYSSSTDTTDIAIDKNKLQAQFNWVKGQDKLQTSKIYYLHEYQERVTDYSSVCSPYTETDAINGTITEYQNCTQVEIGSHLETRQEWKEFSSLTLEKNKIYYIDIRGKFLPNSDFSVDVIPDITLSGTKFVMSEMAVWQGTLLKDCYNITFTHQAGGELKEAYVSGNLSFTAFSVNNYSKQFWIGNSTSSFTNFIVWNTTSTDLNWSLGGYNFTSGDVLSVCVGNNTYNGNDDPTVLPFLNRSRGWDRYTFDEQTASNDSLNAGFVKTGGTNGDTTSWEIGSAWARNGTRGMQLATGATDILISKNFTNGFISNPIFYCIEVWDNAQINQNGMGITSHTTWTSAGNAAIDDYISLYSSTAWIEYGGNETRLPANKLGSYAVPLAWTSICVAYHPNGKMSIWNNGTRVLDKGTLSGTPSTTFNKLFLYGSVEKHQYDTILVGRGIPYQSSANITSSVTAYWTQQTQSQTVTESQGDSAIQAGIASSTINTSSSNYTSQQVYMRNSAGTQQLGRFDVVASSGSQRWAFNYVTSNDATSSFTYMVNITPVLYVWEAGNLTTAQISEQVKAFIDGTKQ
ncbi:MAG: hypothetical protein V1886_03375 [archaeon]